MSKFSNVIESGVGEHFVKGTFRKGHECVHLKVNLTESPVKFKSTLGILRNELKRLGLTGYVLDFDTFICK